MCSITSPLSSEWQVPFLGLLPAIERQARRALRRLPADEREEACQAVVAYAAVAYARLAELGKAELGYASPLASYGVRQYRAGRNVGSSICSRDVASPACQRRRGFAVAPFDEQSHDVVDRSFDPARRGGLRIDIGAWLNSLSPRDRNVAEALAGGERTTTVAKKLQLTPGRVSQMRRQLYDSWRRFTGEAAVASA